MLDAGPRPVSPPALSVENLEIPDTLDQAFEGWSEAAFGILDRLRETPHIEQYKKEKPGVTDDLKDPFRRYRDDLVVNWVLPNRLDFETERNVFSRLLKNDFGAGGCHDNLWMAFYRPETKRLKDVQISHRISPDGFDVGLYVGAYATDLLGQAQHRIEQAPATYLGKVNGLLEQDPWTFGTHRGSGQSATRTRHDAPLDAVPDAVPKADGIFLRHRIPRPDVLALGPDLVATALDAVLDLWPIYRFYLAPR
jgi:hypothetical protein